MDQGELHFRKEKMKHTKLKARPVRSSVGKTVESCRELKMEEQNVHRVNTVLGMRRRENMQEKWSLPRLRLAIRLLEGSHSEIGEEAMHEGDTGWNFSQ